MLNIKKELKIAFIVLIIFLLLTFLFTENIRIGYLIDYGIYFPKPISMNNIYHFEFREGDDFDIWLYEESKFNKVISKKDFDLIVDENISDIKNKIIEYYNGLDKEEMKLFKEHANIDELVNKNNYYLYKVSKTDNKTFKIIIADSASKKLYFFNTVR